MKKLFPCVLILLASIQIVYAETPAQTNIEGTPTNSKTLQTQTEQQIKAAQEAQAQQQIQTTSLYQMQPAESAIPTQDQLQDSQIILPTLVTQSLFQSNYKTDPTTNPNPSSNPKNGKGIFYTVDYDPSSKIKEIPLKNIRMNVEVYYYGNPEGRMNIQIDDSQNFVFDKYPENSYVALEVLSLSDESQYNAKCRGLVSPGSTKIKIKCNHSKSIFENQ